MARPSLIIMALNAIRPPTTRLDFIRLEMVVGLSNFGLAVYDVVINKNAFDPLSLGSGLA